MTQVELARRAGTSQAAIARYEAGVSSPAVSTLERVLHAMGRGLELRTSDAVPTDLSSTGGQLVRGHRIDIIHRAREHGVTNVRLFGSTARGEDRADSDIDLLVDFDSSQGLFPLVQLKIELEGLLGREVDLAPVELLKPEVAVRALTEAVPL
jgi:predicted nucleotidyltransferase